MDVMSKYTDEQRTKYYFLAGVGGDLEDFLRKYKPSIITSDDAPWIWCGDGKGESGDNAVTVSKGADILEGLVDQLKIIENDPAIPVRAKKGQKSKKALRDEATADATATLKDLSLESGYTNGKWLLYPSHESVDGVWARIARSVEKGPLRAAGADTAKVATTDNPEFSQVICVYYDNVYNRDKTEKILRALLNHGLEPSAVKSDLYTVIGLDSKHPSRMRSSIWRPTDFMSKDDVKAITSSWNKDKEKQLYAELDVKHAVGTGKRENGEAKRGNVTGKLLCGRSEKLIPAQSGSVAVTAGSGTAQPQDRTGKPEPGGSKPDSGHAKPQSHDARPGSGDTKRHAPSLTSPSPKRVKSAARRFREEDVFVGSDNDSD